MIEFKGKQYETRELYLDKHRGSVTVARLDLSEAIGDPHKMPGRGVDEQIAYYADNDEWELSDKELKEAIYGPTKKQR